MTIRQVLTGTLAACGLAFIIRLAKSVIASRRHASETTPGPPAPHQLAIGFVTNFLDTLGIGSFATTTAIFRLLGEPADELIPGTLIAGHALPVLAQALIFINVVSVDPAQLGLLIAASIAGGWLGAGVVSSLSRRAVQLGMGAALLTAAAFMVVGLSGLFPAGGTALRFEPAAFVVALAINFVLGALLTLGIGNYAPSLVAFALLGIDPRAAFPIMMGSGAFVALVAGARFIGRGAFISARRWGSRWAECPASPWPCGSSPRCRSTPSAGSCSSSSSMRGPAFCEPDSAHHWRRRD